MANGAIIAVDKFTDISNAISRLINSSPVDNVHLEYKATWVTKGMKRLVNQHKGIGIIIGTS